MDHVRLFTFINDGSSILYKDRIIFRENSHEIVKILADKNKLYTMCKAGEAYRFRCFNLESQTLQLTGLIENIEKIYPLFIDEFYQASKINGNILIVNEDKIVKIYDN